MRRVPCLLAVSDAHWLSGRHIKGNFLFIGKVFEDLWQNYSRHKWTIKMAILAKSSINFLCNLGSPKLCNGTRLLVKSLLIPKLIEATILTGLYKGEHTFIPRISITPNQLSFQFPTSLGFGMTINKSKSESCCNQLWRALLISSWYFCCMLKNTCLL